MKTNQISYRVSGQPNTQEHCNTIIPFWAPPYRYKDRLFLLLKLRGYAPLFIVNKEWESTKKRGGFFQNTKRSAQKRLTGILRTNAHQMKEFQLLRMLWTQNLKEVNSAPLLGILRPGGKRLIETWELRHTRQFSATTTITNDYHDEACGNHIIFPTKLRVLWVCSPK